MGTVRRYIRRFLHNITYPSSTCISSFFTTAFLLCSFFIIESVDSISRDERGFPLTQYITNEGISRTRYTITHFKHHHRFLRRFPIE